MVMSPALRNRQSQGPRTNIRRNLRNGQVVLHSLACFLRRDLLRAHAVSCAPYMVFRDGIWTSDKHLFCL